jgi:DNA polymerase-3 subunit delta'
MPQELQLEETILKRFAFLKERGRLAHSYLFIGPSDIGKGETALAIARLMNCEKPDKETSCGCCPSCVKTDSGNHPDIFMIDNGYGESIKIEQIREILNRNKLRAFMGGRKVFILRNAENLTLDGANAFLKTLEEPANDTLLILTTAAPDKILDTIKSRCHTVYFPSMSHDFLADRLKKDCGVEDVDAHVLTYFAQGCLRTAKRMDEEGFAKRKNELIDSFILGRPEESEIKELLGDKAAAKELLDIISRTLSHISLMIKHDRLAVTRIAGLNLGQNIIEII